MTRRDDREYREYLREKQRSQRGCIAGRMQLDFHHGLLGDPRRRWPSTKEVARMNAPLIAVVTVALSAPLAAQWLTQPTPGIPRTPDGKPNLNAAAPRTPDGKPDLSGLWNKISPKYARNIAADLKPEEIQPWARALVEQRREDLGR